MFFIYIIFIWIIKAISLMICKLIIINFIRYIAVLFWCLNIFLTERDFVSNVLPQLNALVPRMHYCSQMGWWMFSTLNQSFSIYVSYVRIGEYGVYSHLSCSIVMNDHHDGCKCAQTDWTGISRRAVEDSAGVCDPDIHIYI